MRYPLRALGSKYGAEDMFSVPAGDDHIGVARLDRLSGQHDGFKA